MLFLEAPVKCGGFLQNGHGAAEGGLGWGLWPPPVLVMVHTPAPVGGLLEDVGTWHFQHKAGEDLQGHLDQPQPGPLTTSPRSAVSAAGMTAQP